MSDRMAERAFPWGAFIMHCPPRQPTAALRGAAGDACRCASTEGVRGALMIAVCLLFVAGCLYVLAARTLRGEQYNAGAGLGLR
jgi:hypothetical protein